MAIQAPPDRREIPLASRTGRPQPYQGGARAGAGTIRRIRRSLRPPARFILFFFEATYDQLAFGVRVFAGLPRAIRYRREITLLVSDITMGAGALVVGGGTFLVVMSITFFTGSLVGLEGYSGLHLIGAGSLTGVIASLGNTREITPLVAGDVFAAQVGASFTAQLGAMRISEEIDALEVMGVDPLPYLVGTRVIASLITMIPLYTASLFASYLASEVMATKFFSLSSGVYKHYFQLFLSPLDVFDSYIKAIVFVVFITLVHCYYGYHVKGGPAEVGEATGRAIRISVIGVVIISLFLSMVMFGGLNTSSARLVG